MIFDVRSAVNQSGKCRRLDVESSMSKAAADVTDKSICGDDGIAKSWDGSNKVPFKKVFGNQ